MADNTKTGEALELRVADTSAAWSPASRAVFHSHHPPSSSQAAKQRYQSRCPQASRNARTTVYMPK
jgi:hypothetical protein